MGVFTPFLFFHFYIHGMVQKLQYVVEKYFFFFFDLLGRLVMNEAIWNFEAAARNSCDVRNIYCHFPLK